MPIAPKWLKLRTCKNHLAETGFYGVPPMKNVPLSGPHFGPASLDFHLNRPVISLIQLHIVARPPAPLAGIMAPLAPIWLVPEPPLGGDMHSQSHERLLAFACNVFFTGRQHSLLCRALYICMILCPTLCCSLNYYTPVQ